MSNKVTKWAYSIPLPLAKKSILVALAYYANDNGTCFPSFTTLSKMTGMSRRSAITQISSLEKLGIISRVSDKNHNSNLYQLHILEDDFNSLPSEPDSLPPSEPPSPPSEPRSPVDESKGSEPPSLGSEPPSLGSEPPSLALVNVVHPNSKLNSQLTVIELKQTHCPVVQKTDNEDDVGNVSPSDEKATKKKKKEEKEINCRTEAKEIIDFLNQMASKHFRHSEPHLKLIMARLKSGVEAIDCRRVIITMVDTWKKNPSPKFANLDYATPDTLFNATKFEKYFSETKKRFSEFYHEE